MNRAFLPSAFLIVIILGAAMSPPLRAAVPHTVPFQGRVLVQGVPFQGTGQFKFALVNPDGSQTFWSNSEDTSPVDGVPDIAVNLEVTKGLYSVLLGDTTVPNMAGNLTPSVLALGEVRLRVWFNDGVRGFQQLAPDPPLGSVPYALVASTVADNPVFMGNVGIGIEIPSAPLDVAGRINAGSISLAGFRALDMPGSGNVFVGNAGNLSTTSFNTTGLGWGVLSALTVGFNNTAVGAYALSSATSGGLNTALGVASLYETTEGIGNTAIGHDALHDNTTGIGNIAGGWDAGRNLTTGNDNIAIGHCGVAGESGTIRIGTPGLHHTTHLSGAVKAERFEGDGSGLTQVPGTMETTGTVVAWGAENVTLFNPTSVPAGLSDVVAVAAGGSNTLALKEDGTLVQWGFGYVPPDLTGVIAIAQGEAHTVAVKQDGTVIAWGYSENGQTAVPPDLTGVKSVAAGTYHTIALKQDGTVVAWGGTGASGTFDSGQANVPEGLAGVIAIAAANHHSVALKEDGTVVAWGALNGKDFGQTRVPVGLSGVIAIAAGPYHTVALKEDGSIVAWGGESGTDYGQVSIPIGSAKYNAIAAGYYHTVALKDDGTVVAWGAEPDWLDYGQTSVPAGLSAVSSIAAGRSHTVALRHTRHLPQSLHVSGTVSAQAFLNTSDRDAKQQITPVDIEAVLSKVAQLPLAEWSFKAAPTTRHLGPMAQDFRAAFGLGPDDRHIATVDADGVALAAIQALYRRVLALERQLEIRNGQLTSELVDSPVTTSKTQNPE